MLLELTKTESIVFEELKTWPKTKYELEQSIDQNKEYSESFIKVIISNINKKAGYNLIKGYNEWWYYKYKLSTKQDISYKLVEWIWWLLDEFREIKYINKKIICDTCPYKVFFTDRRYHRFLRFIIALLLCAFFYILWYVSCDIFHYGF